MTKQTQNKKVLVHLPSMASAFVCASKDDAREYLRSVFITWHEDVTHYVSTDGHRMCFARPDKQSFNKQDNVFKFKPEAHDSFIIHAADVKEILKWKTRSSLVCTEYVIMEIVDGSKVVFHSYDSRKSYVVTPVNQTYPDWKRVIPKERSQRTNEIVGMNANYLSCVKDIAKNGFNHPTSTVPLVKCEINANDKPSKFVFGDEDGAMATLIVMPMRI